MWKKKKYEIKMFENDGQRIHNGINQNFFKYLLLRLS